MDIRTEARAALEKREADRLYDFKAGVNEGFTPSLVSALLTAFDAAVNQWASPVDEDVAVNAEWRYTGIVVEVRRPQQDTPSSKPDGSMQFFVMPGDEGPSLYALGSCPRCEQSTPLAPALSGSDRQLLALGIVDDLRQPVEAHVCRSASGEPPARD